MRESIDNLLQFIDKAPISTTALLVNLIIGMLLSLFIRWHFKRFGSTLSNREEFGQVFPFVLLTTVLIITIVKSSIALSLGLVGALSIVRFRTPIKEPEELAYLFVSIAIGIGLGAGQTISTIVAGLTILGILAALRWDGIRFDVRLEARTFFCPLIGKANNTKK
jgi:predicted membrane protein